MSQDDKPLKYPIHTPTIYEHDDIVRPTLVEVDLSKLRHNFNAIKQHVRPAKMMPVLKANAYGHGLVRVARLMQELGADALGVAFLEEGVLLRKKGVTLPILVMGGVLGNQVPYFIEHDLMITASSITKLKQIDQAAERLQKTANVHLII
ncbi:MAG: alanine racemase [candidate division KSB1 bacterium]|nr:alanine racemase [candidate division KSB1 bacterium]